MGVANPNCIWFRVCKPSVRRQAHGRLSKYEPNAIGIGNPPTPSNMYLGVPKQFHTKILAADMEFLALVFHQILVLASEKVPSGCPSPAQHSLSGGKDISGEGGLPKLL